MKNLFQQIEKYYDACLALFEKIEQLLTAERTALILLKTDDVVCLNQQKETLLKTFNNTKQHIMSTVDELVMHLGADWQTHMPEPIKWQDKKKRFYAQWEKIQHQCDDNQRFMQQSLRNLGQLVDNLKRLMGETPLYSPKGTKVDMATAGKVIEAKY